MYLTLGPVLFNWPPDKWRDFYFRIADEAPIDVVYIGEIVCAKRIPFLVDALPAAVSRLEAGGKKVILSSLALMMSDRELSLAEEMASDGQYMMEANDLAAVAMLGGHPHVIGPYINLYNEATLELFAQRGAIRAVIAPEVPGRAIELLARASCPLEVQVFGRAPLAISARCYHARAENLHKDRCRFVCERDPDGLPVHTLSGEPFLAVNGLQTLSHSCVNLAPHLPELRAFGVKHFRLSPHTADMVAISRLFHDAVRGRIEAEELTARLPRIADGAAFSDGFYRGDAGITSSLALQEHP